MTEQKSSARFGWLAGAVGAGVLTFSVLTFNDHSVAQPATPRAPATVGVSFADVIDSVSPAVVNIAVMKTDAAAPTSFAAAATGRKPASSSLTAPTRWSRRRGRWPPPGSPARRSC